MNTVHAAREAAPTFTTRKQHPIDVISISSRQIRSLALLIDYALEKQAEHQDAPSTEHFSICMMLILELADEVEAGLQDFQNRYDAVERRDA